MPKQEPGRGREFSWRRALVVWLLIVVLESAQGVLRQLYLVPVLGDLQSRQLGVATGTVIILLVAVAAARWVGVAKVWTLLGVGAVWVALTVAFEVGLGLAFGVPAQRLLADYRLSEGGYLGVGMMFMLLAPLVASRVVNATGIPKKGRQPQRGTVG